MPRYTLIEVDDFAEHRGPFYLKSNQYKHFEEIDFASEAGVKEAIATWELLSNPKMRVIVEYENLANAQWKINAFTVLDSLIIDECNHPFVYTYKTSLMVNINQAGKMCGNLLPGGIAENFSEFVEQYVVDYIYDYKEKMTLVEGMMLVEEMTFSEEANSYLIPEFILAEIKENVEEAFNKKYKGDVTSEDLDAVMRKGYQNPTLTENNYNKIRLFMACEQPVAALREHINKLSGRLQAYDVAGENEQKIYILDEMLNFKLDEFVAAIKYSDNIDKDFYNTFKKEFIQRLDQSGLFSSSRFEALRHHILTALNRLIEILSGKKIVSISSKTDFFEKKRAMPVDIKNSLEDNIKDPQGTRGF